MAGFAVLVLGALVALLAFSGFDLGMVAGAGIGLGVAMVLLVFNEVTTRLALREQRKGAALGHIYGGFLLRLVLLVVGFFALATTGAANPAAFALAFLAGVMLMLGWQVFRVARQVQRRAQTA